MGAGQNSAHNNLYSAVFPKHQADHVTSLPKIFHSSVSFRVLKGVSGAEDAEEPGL
jgi:hypothetical protein